MGFFKDLGGILKQAGGVFASVFGLDKFAKSDEGQALQDGANDIMKQLGKQPIFQTKKVKEAAEKRAAEQTRLATIQNAENSRRIAEALEELNRNLRS